MDRHTELFCYVILAEFADAAEQLLAGDVLYADGTAMRLNDPVQLFDDNNFLNVFGERLNFFHRQGIDHAKLQNRVPVAADLFDVLIAGRGRDQANRMVGPVLHAVDLRCLGPCLQGKRPLLHNGVPSLGAGRHHHKFGNILFIGNRRECLPLRRLHHALRVRNAGAHFEKHRRVKFFGYLIRQLCERQRFRRVRRLKHRQFCRNGVMARILLVLRRMHTCVVRHADDKSAAHTGIGQRKQRVCRNIQADVLHAAEAAVACQTCAERSLHRYLFVRRPFCVNFRIFGSAFRDLRAGCAGIAGDKAASGLVQAARGSLIAEHQGFHRDSSCSRLSRMKIIIIF